MAEVAQGSSPMHMRVSMAIPAPIQFPHAREAVPMVLGKRVFAYHHHPHHQQLHQQQHQQQQMQGHEGHGEGEDEHEAMREAGGNTQHPFFAAIKRRRALDGDEDGQMEHPYTHEDSDSENHLGPRLLPQIGGPEKRMRFPTAQDDAMDLPAYSERQLSYIHQQHQQRMNALREEYERAISDKHTELENVVNDQQQLVGTLQNLQGEHERSLEENRLLKRAVNFQHQKQEEDRYHVQQLEHSFAQAIEQIQRQERTIENLKAQLQMFNSPHSLMFQPPPDVC